MQQFDIVIYGSYGYTGGLITDECRSKGLNVLLSGRDDSKLKLQSENIGYPFEVCDINDASGLVDLLRKAKVAIHCAGPFQQTARQMVEACLETGTHYTDITGEYTVFEMMAGYDAIARKKGILIMPGTGFDVVPTDCLAVHLKNRLPRATNLQLAFSMSKGGLSRGTGRTMVEGLGYGGMIRKNGKLIPIAMGEKVMDVNFGGFVRRTLCIPWGDIATAWRSTGIPNIEVYSAVPGSVILGAKMSRYFNWLMRRRWVKDFLRRKVDARPAGPGAPALLSGRSYLWGRVTDDNGNTVEARLNTASGYLLTARMAVLIADELITSEKIVHGYFTPAQYFGAGLISRIEGTVWTT